MAYVERFVCDYKKSGRDKDGKWYTYKCPVEAEDAHKDIAVEEIVAACEELGDYASGLDQIGVEIFKLGSEITLEDLSVEGTGVSYLFTQNTIDARHVGTKIGAHVSEIKARAIEVFNERQTRYNIRAQRKCDHPF